MFTEKLSFEARLPKEDSLITHDGKQVQIGHVELFFENPEYDTDIIQFIDAFEDKDTGDTCPPSFSLYAKLNLDTFMVIRNSNTNTLVTLTIHTSFMGAIQFNNPTGEAKIWNTLRDNPVIVESYEITLSEPY